MGTRGIYDTQGELFAYIEGNLVYTLDGEQVGRVLQSEIVNMQKERMWLIRGDGLFSESGEPVGYLGSERAEERFR